MTQKIFQDYRPPKIFSFFFIFLCFNLLLKRLLFAKRKKKKENKKQPFLYEKLQMADISNLSERKINITLHTRRKKRLFE